MTTLSFEIETSEVSRLIAILKACGVKKLTIEEDKIKFTQEEFIEKLKKAKEGKRTSLQTKEDVANFINSL